MPDDAYNTILAYALANVKARRENRREDAWRYYQMQRQAVSDALATAAAERAARNEERSTANQAYSNQMQLGGKYTEAANAY
ncbi:MAG TPA: hypothetical protein VEI97_15725, partial [bacterium]|nr:hypothetical protein [bacterium]